MLRFTDANLKLISDIEKYQLIESTIRGGIFRICKGYVDYKPYDSNKPVLYIIYLDANNLYVPSMMQLLPTEILDWVDPKDFTLDYYSNGSVIRCFIEANLNCPEEMHDLHNDYPLAGEKMKVREEMVSNYQLQIIEDNNFFLGKNKKTYSQSRQ